MKTVESCSEKSLWFNCGKKIVTQVINLVDHLSNGLDKRYMPPEQVALNEFFEYASAFE